MRATCLELAEYYGAPSSSLVGFMDGIGWPREAWKHLHKYPWSQWFSRTCSAYLLVGPKPGGSRNWAPGEEQAAGEALNRDPSLLHRSAAKPRKAALTITTATYRSFDPNRTTTSDCSICCRLLRIHQLKTNQQVHFKITPRPRFTRSSAGYLLAKVIHHLHLHKSPEKRNKHIFPVVTDSLKQMEKQHKHGGGRKPFCTAQMGHLHDLVSYSERRSSSNLNPRILARFIPP